VRWPHRERGGGRHRGRLASRDSKAVRDREAKTCLTLFSSSQSCKTVLDKIVGKVGRMLFFCTEAVTHNFQIAFERPQYRVKWHVLDHIRPPSTLQNFQYSIETIFAF